MSTIHKGIMKRGVGYTACDDKVPQSAGGRTNRWVNVTCAKCWQTNGFANREAAMKQWGEDLKEEMGRKMSITNAAGWYHSTQFDETGEIWFCADPHGPDCDGEPLYGPFPTFAAARKDAIDYHRCNLSVARNRIAELRARKAPKK